MKRAIVPALFICVSMLFAANARADAADDACQQIMADRSTTPDMFSMMCPNKNDLARVCENQVKKLGPESGDNFVVRFFITPNAQCKDKKSVQSFCTFVQSYDGYQVLALDAALLPDPSDPDYANLTHPRDRSAKVCGTTTEAIRTNLCSKADELKKWGFAYAECPAEGRKIFLRECVKPHTTDGEGGLRVVTRTEAECIREYDSRTRK